jgi:hypothetical protein
MTAGAGPTSPVRIGNASGFYGDRFSAWQEMLTSGDLDVLTGDYLAELTMLILARDRARDPSTGYAKTFLRQLEGTLGLALDRGVSLVSNAGGLNPAGLADAIRALADRLGLQVTVAHVEGDDLLPRADELGLTGPDGRKPLAANAYLGGWGIAESLRSGADVVVTGRVTDASLVVGPAAAHFGWQPDDFSAVAGAMVAGHVIECGAQATGGNYAFFTELLDRGVDLTRPGFPIAEVHPDGSSVITKHDGTGGAVTVGTVTAQLLYEVAGGEYLGPDAVTRLDRVGLRQDGPDRVRIQCTGGLPPPATLKVSLNHLGGYRNEVTFVIAGLDVEAKAVLARHQFEAALPVRPAELRWTLVRSDRPDADTEEGASAVLRCTAKDADPTVVGRPFSAAAVELALAGYPGFHLTAPPTDASPYGVFTAGYLDAAQVSQVAVLPNGSRVTIPAPSRHRDRPDPNTPAAVPPEAAGLPGPGPLPPGCRPEDPTRRAPLGSVAGARSGDKGGDANLGLWVRTPQAWGWLAHTLSTPRLRDLLPEVGELAVDRYLLPNLLAMNFVIHGLLGQGVAAQHRFDPQAKALGEWLRSRHVDIPVVLL